MDVIAALTLWALLVPEAMVYVGIAGMPPETGLDAAPLALIAYAILDGKKIGYWLGLIMATLSAGRWFLFVPGFPLWSLSMVGLWLLVVCGLIKDRKYFVQRGHI